MDLACNLCPNIIYKILTCASMETMGRYRLLSKEWNKLNYESTFMKATQSKNQYYLWFLHTNHNPK